VPWQDAKITITRNAHLTNVHGRGARRVTKSIMPAGPAQGTIIATTAIALMINIPTTSTTVQKRARASRRKTIIAAVAMSAYINVRETGARTVTESLVPVSPAAVTVIVNPAIFAIKIMEVEENAKQTGL